MASVVRRIRRSGHYRSARQKRFDWAWLRQVHALPFGHPGRPLCPLQKAAK